MTYFKPDQTMKPELWQAQWIWLNKQKYADYQKTHYTYFSDKQDMHYALALFRKQFEVNKAIKKVMLYISADVKYRLHINGERVGRGPAEIGGDYGNQDVLDYWFYDTYEVKESIKQGTNILGVEISLQTGIQCDYSQGQGGLILEMHIQYSDGTEETIISDETFKAVRNEAALEADCYDARLDRGEWLKDNFDDTSWEQAEVIPSRSLIHKPIPHLTEEMLYPKTVLIHYPQYETRIQDKENLLQEAGETLLTKGSPLTFSLDFGRIYSGRIQLEIEGAAGTHLTFYTQEIAGKNEQKIVYTLKEGLQTFENMNLLSVRYLYLTVSNFTSPIRIKKIGLLFSHYPTPRQGYFQCNDSLLTAIYEAGKNTLEMCRQSYHLDSPIHQEALGCTGDYMILSLMNYYVFGDKHLSRLDIWRTAQMLKKHQGFMFHTSYSLLYVQMVKDYVFFTGDQTILEDVLPVIEALMTRFKGYIGSSGTIEQAPNYMFMDWVPCGTYNLHHPPKTVGQGYLTAFYYKALQDVAHLEALRGRDAEERSYRQEAEQLKKAFHACFWVEEKGLYCDGRKGDVPTVPNEWLPADTEEIHFSQHTNALAVLYDLAPQPLHQSIMYQVVTEPTLTQAQPYFMHFVLEAIHHAGLFNEQGLKQIRRWKRLLEENEATLKEVWEGFDCDYSHAWGGTPTYQLPSKVLGIRPLKSAFEEVLIMPQMGDLEWAEGSIPLPTGNLQVRVEQTNKEYRLHIICPKECNIVFQWPVEASQVYKGETLEGEKSYQVIYMHSME
ncbi:hypothetical protein CS063_03785 [Sporanaerobium hydrogeniformans]|uniref:Uncharacterized protein n=1 Tax=Sporanaerobium hydrogeniformans TaxID=3072179 RepID=A0AC61DGG4_9FIRM|nr:alpha-L-rhamnosidase N-terminal domain-containing protein [Sporanaerobium hydrogeniformans]PHV71692.1 hypothetical protein CS063_03785 [Sporanaerobium hydrogeniformans]